MNLRKKATLCLVFLWLFGLFSLLLSDKEIKASIIQVQKADMVTGSKLFTPTCSNGYCHGKDGIGGSAPALRGKNYSLDYLLRVISNGIIGTPMPAFKNNYSKKEIEQLASYVLWLSKQDGNKPLPPLQNATGDKRSDENAETKSEPTNTPIERRNTEKGVSDSSILSGDAAAGRRIFFDTLDESSCRVCHSFQGRGGKVGPDLSGVGNKSARELFQNIVTPGTTISTNYASVALTTNEGERIIGVKRDEDSEVVRVYDTASMPPVLRTIQKTNITKIEAMNHSVMPNDYSSRYTLKQILDLIAFLKSSDKSVTIVSLKDLF